MVKPPKISVESLKRLQLQKEQAAAKRAAAEEAEVKAAEARKAAEEEEAVSAAAAAAEAEKEAAELRESLERLEESPPPAKRPKPALLEEINNKLGMVDEDTSIMSEIRTTNGILVDIRHLLLDLRNGFAAVEAKKAAASSEKAGSGNLWSSNGTGYGGSGGFEEGLVRTHKPLQPCRVAGQVFGYAEAVKGAVVEGESGGTESEQSLAAVLERIKSLEKEKVAAASPSYLQTEETGDGKFETGGARGKAAKESEQSLGSLLDRLASLEKASVAPSSLGKAVPQTTMSKETKVGGTGMEGGESAALGAALARIRALEASKAGGSFPPPPRPRIKCLLCNKEGHPMARCQRLAEASRLLSDK